MTGARHAAVEPASTIEAASNGSSPRAGTGRSSIGMLGGTFDPIHLGHLALARAARASLGLDEILFVPAARPPHKLGRPISPASDRLAMVELAIEGEPATRVSDIEIDRSGPSYTVDTVAALLDEAARDDGSWSWPRSRSPPHPATRCPSRLPSPTGFRASSAGWP